eukprot:230943_1
MSSTQKWRCKSCGQRNEHTLSHCGKCNDAKTGKKEKKKGANSKSTTTKNAKKAPKSSSKPISDKKPDKPSTKSSRIGNLFFSRKRAKTLDPTTNSIQIQNSLQRKSSENITQSMASIKITKTISENITITSNTTTKHLNVNDEKELHKEPNIKPIQTKYQHEITSTTPKALNIHKKITLKCTIGSKASKEKSVPLTTKGNESEKWHKNMSNIWKKAK